MPAKGELLIFSA